MNPNQAVRPSQTPRPLQRPLQQQQTPQIDSVATVSQAVSGLSLQNTTQIQPRPDQQMNQMRPQMGQLQRPISANLRPIIPHQLNQRPIVSQQANQRQIIPQQINQRPIMPQQTQNSQNQQQIQRPNMMNQRPVMPQQIQQRPNMPQQIQNSQNQQHIQRPNIASRPLINEQRRPETANQMSSNPNGINQRPTLQGPPSVYSARPQMPNLPQVVVLNNTGVSPASGILGGEYSQNSIGAGDCLNLM